MQETRDGRECVRRKKVAGNGVRLRTGGEDGRARRARGCAGRTPPGTGCGDVQVIGIRRMFAAAVAAAIGAGPGTPCADAPEPAAPEERLLIAALGALRDGRMDTAVAMIEESLGQAPDFRLARLVYADLLAAKAGAPAAFGGPRGGPRAETLQDEARKRIRRHRDAAVPERMPAALLRLSPDQPLAVVVDIGAAALYVFENVGDGNARLLSHHYVSTGRNGAVKWYEGDQRTPVGVYFTTGRIAAKILPDFYGTGAIPIDYPNEWDRRLGRTGYGIWIHGVPTDTYARAPLSSDGCLALPNHHFTLLSDRLGTAVATPVVIGETLEWTVAGDVRRRRAGLDRAVRAWARDRESRDPGRYARHYSREFRGESSGYRAWLTRERRADAAGRPPATGIGNLSLFAYPGEPGLVVATFEQDRGGDLTVRVRKRQYWRREADGAWRIVYEGAVELRPEHLRGIPFSARSGVAPAGGVRVVR